jgi:abortive infection bacteriophage resistance protein
MIMVSKNPVKKVGNKRIFSLSSLLLYLGISLATDQWEKLKTLINQVDKDLKKSK